MNSYITLDSKKYVCPGEAWVPELIKPSEIRFTVNGDLDATYGPGNYVQWSGFIRAYVTPASGYGSPSDLRTSLKKSQGLTFYDHYGTTLYTVHVQGYKEKSATVKWDGASNYIDFSVTLRAKA